MNYSKLSKALPKRSQLWTGADVKTWLGFIQLSTYENNFVTHNVNGSNLTTLNQDLLKIDLEISSRIAIKKLMRWITQGIKDFNAYLSKSMCLNQGSMTVEQPYPVSKTQSLNSQDSTKIVKLVLQQKDDFNNLVSYYMDNEGGKIGRLNKSTVYLLNPNISREHARVKYQNNIFHLQDVGSLAGTFIRIDHQVQLKSNQIFQIGSHEFKVRQKKGRLYLSIEASEEDGKTKDYSWVPIKLDTHETLKIGRIGDCKQLSFFDDPEMNNVHCLITKIKKRYYLIDNNSTNGVWMRLSSSGNTSQFHPLQRKSTIRFGAEATFDAYTKTTTQVPVAKVNNPCSVCYQNEKNCVVIPCKHISSCVKCTKNVKNCPICRIKIEEIIRVYP